MESPQVYISGPLLVDFPSDYPERITSVERGGVEPEMGRTGGWLIRVGGVR